MSQFNKIVRETQMIWEGHLSFCDGRKVRVTIHLHDDGAILGGVQTPEGGSEWKLFADIAGDINKPILGF